MIVVVEDISKECLCLHHLKALIVVLVVLVKDDFDVLDAILLALLPTGLQSINVVVEHVSCEQIRQEIESNSHEENEEEAIEEIGVHGW